MIRVSKLRKVYQSQGWSNLVLNDVSFELRPGQKLAVIGKNGAGKSTLIRLLGKVELPTSGRVDHFMSVSWPLGFSGAFQGSLTGIDNMRFIARIYGLDYEQMREFVEDFSELGQFLYQPVKTYSAGMRARLAFALSLTIEFQCYLIDEVILVGDQRFHARCKEHLFNRRSDRALVLASHDASFVQEVCDSGLVLSKGRAYYFEDVREAMRAYEDLEGTAPEPTPAEAGSAAAPAGAELEAAAAPCDAPAVIEEGSAEHLVESLYRHVLGREPDSVGFADHVQRLKAHGVYKELPNLIRDFVNSEEARARFKPREQG